ncbi:hypothetical protein LEMLEM_LOCUS7455, partial [Lemmus lemmus]
KSLTRDCWGRLLLLQGPSFFYKEGWRLLFLFFFFFFLMNGGRRRLLQLAQLRGLYPPPSLQEEVLIVWVIFPFPRMLSSLICWSLQLSNLPLESRTFVGHEGSPSSLPALCSLSKSEWPTSRPPPSFRSI